MKKLILTPFLALVAMLSTFAPAQAAVGPDWNQLTDASECGLISCTSTNMKVWFSDRHNGAVTVNQVRLWAGDPDDLRANNALTIHSIKIYGPAGAVKWSKGVENDIQVDKQVGAVSIYWNPSFDVDVYGSMSFNVTLHWADGSSDDVVMNGGSIG